MVVNLIDELKEDEYLLEDFVIISQNNSNDQIKRDQKSNR